MSLFLLSLSSTLRLAVTTTPHFPALAHSWWVCLHSWPVIPFFFTSVAILSLASINLLILVKKEAAFLIPSWSLVLLSFQRVLLTLVLAVLD